MNLVQGPGRKATRPCIKPVGPKFSQGYSIVEYQRGTGSLPTRQTSAEDIGSQFPCAEAKGYDQTAQDSGVRLGGVQPSNI